MGPGGSTLQTLVTSIWVGIGKIDNCFVFTLVLKRTLSYLRFLKAGKKKKKKKVHSFLAVQEDRRGCLAGGGGCSRVGCAPGPAYRLEVPGPHRGAGLPTGTWWQLGRLPQFPGLCWAQWPSREQPGPGPHLALCGVPVGHSVVPSKVVVTRSC